MTAWFAALLLAAGDAPVADAAERGEWEAVVRLAETAEVGQQPGGSTALHYAARAGQVDAVAALLAAGWPAAGATTYGVTPLELACEGGHAEAARLLLDAGADAGQATGTGRTMLMTAARCGSAETVRLLTDRGAAVNAADPSGQTALMWAAAEGHADAVDALLAAGADPDAESRGGFTAMLFAARNGRADACDRLLDAGVDVNAVIRTKNTSGRRPRARMSALMFAVESGHFELALRLAERGADPNDLRSGYASLHALTWVRKANRGDGVDGDPEPRGSGSVPSLEFARRLVAAGADVDLRLTRGRGGRAVLNPKGATPLLMASHAADLPYMNALLELGADPRATNEDGCTTLAAAAGVGVVSLVDEDPGTEPETIAAVSRLAGLGVDVNAVDNNGETAMHGAAYRNYPALVRHLAALGADPAVWNRPNRHGTTPADIARGDRPGSFKPSPETEAALLELLGEAASSD